MSHRITIFALLTVIVFALAGCVVEAPVSESSSAAQDQTSAANADEADKMAATECEEGFRIFTHAMGESCIPEDPQRVVTLEYFSLETAMAVDVKPIGANMNGDINDQKVPLQDRLEGITPVGANLAEPNLELILSLKPDLILSIDIFAEEIYEQLSEIAPTVVYEFQGSGEWKEILRFYADALGRQEAGEQALDEYLSRVEELRQVLGDERESLEISVVRVGQEQLTLYLKTSFIGTILEDVGLPRPPAQDQDEFSEQISLEEIERADGDVIYLWGYDALPPARSEVRSTIEELRDDPIFQLLEGVQQGEVYVAPDYWIGSGILAANAVLDDLFRTLVQE